MITHFSNDFMPF